MPANTALVAELKYEAINTRKLIERVPTDKLQWRPHEKSMTVERLATHIANIPIWVDRIITAKEFDFATAKYNDEKQENTESILKLFDNRIETAAGILESATDETLNELFVFRRGDKVFFQLPKKVTLRNFGYNHLYHHRGQLSVYLRLLDVAIPGMYGPSADEAL